MSEERPTTKEAVKKVLEANRWRWLTLYQIAGLVEQETTRPVSATTVSARIREWRKDGFKTTVRVGKLQPGDACNYYLYRAGEWRE